MLIAFGIGTMQWLQVLGSLSVRRGGRESDLKGVTKMTGEENALYAAMLRLRRRLCVVVGGGEVAARKVGKLLESGARVRVISPHVVPAIAQYAEQGRIEYIAREYREGDASQGFLIFAATNRREVNRRIAEEAERHQKFVNVVDDPERCSFMVPATFSQSGLQVAVSTEGQDPAGAKRLKNILASDFSQGTRRFQDEVKQWWQAQVVKNL